MAFEMNLSAVKQFQVLGLMPLDCRINSRLPVERIIRV